MFVKYAKYNLTRAAYVHQVVSHQSMQIQVVKQILIPSVADKLSNRGVI